MYRGGGFWFWLKYIILLVLVVFGYFELKLLNVFNFWYSLFFIVCMFDVLLMIFLLIRFDRVRVILCIVLNSCVVNVVDMGVWMNRDVIMLVKLIIV